MYTTVKPNLLYKKIHGYDGMMKVPQLIAKTGSPALNIKEVNASLLFQILSLKVTFLGAILMLCYSFKSRIKIILHHLRNISIVIKFKPGRAAFLNSYGQRNK